MNQLLATTPLWVWLLGAGLLGAVTLYLFHRCMMSDALRQLSGWADERRVELEEHQAQLRLLRGTVSERDAALAAADAGDGAAADELRRAKYRSWIYETRLRRALAAAEAGEPIDVAALSADLDAPEEGAMDAGAMDEGAMDEGAMDEGAPPPEPAPAAAPAQPPVEPSTLAVLRDSFAAERSALKFANWTLRNRLAETETIVERAAASLAAAPLEAEDQPTPPTAGERAAAAEAAGLALSETAPILASEPSAADDRADRMATLLQRALSAAKRGELAELTAIEAEAALDGAAEPAAFASAEPEPAAPPAAPQTPSGPAADLAGDLEAMRYRTWLLGDRLRRTLAAAEAGATPDLEAIRVDLARAAAEPRRSAAEAAARAADATPPAPIAIDKLALAEDDTRRLSDENQTLRYRGWALSQRLAGAAALLRAGAALDPDGLTADLDAESLADGETAALAALAARGEAQGGGAEADAMARRINTLEGALGAERAAASANAADARALRDGSASLRYRLWLAHAELRRLRDAAPAAPAAAPAAIGETMRRSALVEARLADLDEAQALRTRLGGAEAALRALRAESAADRAAKTAADGEIAALRSELWSKAWGALSETAADASPAAAEALAAARNDAATLRARLADSEALQQTLADSQARETALAAELEALRAELSGAEGATADLLARVALAEAAAASPAADLSAVERRATLAETERDKLRARLGLAEAELERLRAARAAPAGETPAPMTLAQPAPAAPAGPAVDAGLGPMLGVEAAALELLERPETEEQATERPRDLERADPAADADDLTLLSGLDADLQAALDRLDVRSFKQIAEISPDGLAWIDRRLGLDGRAVAQRWAPQAQRWRDRRAAGELAIGADGRWTTLERAEAAPPPPAPPVADAEEPIETVRLPAPLRAGMKAERADLAPIPPEAVRIDAPLSGLEAAALDLLGDAGFDARADAAPAILDAPAENVDDLTLIHGVGPIGERALNALGLVGFEQLAGLASEDLAWLDRALEADGRTVRERWRAQAAIWADRKRDGLLALAETGAFAGRWTVAARAGLAPAIAEAAPLRETRRADPPLAPRREPRPETTAREPALETAGAASDAAPRAAFLDRGRPPIAPQRPAAGRADIRRMPGARAAIETEAGALLENRDPRLAGHRPALLLPDPANGPRDDLKLIQNAGPKFMDIMNQLGIFYFSQLAQFSALDLAWLDDRLGAAGRVSRDGWASQAHVLQSRKSEGALALGPEGFWTEPSPSAEIDALFERARSLPLSEEELGAMRLLSGPFSPDETAPPEGLLTAASEGPADDLQRIKGVGPRCEALLNRMGVFYYRQIAAFSARDLAWIDAKIHYNGRVIRDRWAAIAKILENETP